MRDLTPLAQQESAKTGQDVVWILSLAWPDKTVHYAHRAVGLADVAPSSGLLAPGQMTAHTPSSAGLSSLLTESRLVLSLALDDGSSPSVRERLEETDPEGLEVVWGLAFLDPAGQAALTDRVALFWGIVEKTRVARQAIELECIDWLSARGRKRFGTVVDRRDLPEPENAAQGRIAEGRMLPWVFGSIHETEIVEWLAGEPLTLDQDVSPDDTRIALKSVDSLPDQGVVQIGDERLEYDSIDRENRTLGAEAVPLKRTEPAYHRAGTAARSVPSSAGFEWLVAGHACRSVSDVRADGLSVAPGDYSSVTDEWRGETIQKVALAKWPCQVEHLNSVATLRFNGTTSPGVWDVETGSTAENPDLAIDGSARETAAELHAGAKVLSLRWLGSLAQGERRYGILQDARLRIRVQSDRLWEPTTRLRLRFRAAEADLDVLLPRPSVADPEAAYGPLDLDLDLGAEVAAHGWDLFAGLDDAPGFEARVELETGGDPVRFRVYDVALEIDYRARSLARMARTLTARVEGVEDEGVLLENPARLVRFFLGDPRALGLDAAHLDEASFAAVAARLDAAGYRFSNRLVTPSALRSILARLLFESGCRLGVSGDRVTLRYDEGDDPLQTAAFVFDGQTILRGERLCLDRDGEASSLRTVNLHHGRDFVPGAHSVSWRRHLLRDEIAHRVPYAESGVDLTDRLEWHNHGDAPPVADLARALLGLHGFRRETVEITAPLKAAILEPGDRVAVVDALFPLDLDQGEVTALAVNDPQCLAVRGRFAVVGRVCWSHDATTFMRHRSSGRLLEFWIEGVLAAALAWDGLWRLRGRVVENATFYGTKSAPISFSPDEDRIYFATGEIGAFAPRFALDSGGNLLVAGALHEDTPRNDLVLIQCNESNADRIALAIAESHPVVVFEVAASALQLRGKAAENERFY